MATIRSFGFDLFVFMPTGMNADVAQYTSGLPRYRRSESRPLVTGRDAHSIAVIADAGNDALDHAAGMQAHRVGNSSGVTSGGANKKHVSIADRFGTPCRVPIGIRGMTPPMPVLAPP